MFKPINDVVVIKINQEAAEFKTASGIIIQRDQNQAVPHHARGKVVSCGEKVTKVATGNDVLVHYRQITTVIDGQEVFLTTEENIIGVFPVEVEGEAYVKADSPSAQ